MEADALVEVMEAGHLAGYAGYGCHPQPAPAGRHRCKMLNHAITPHVSEITSDAQKRYSNGV